MKDNRTEIVIVAGVYPPEPFVSAQMSESIARELAKKNKVTVLCPPVSRPYGTKEKRCQSSEGYKVITLDSYVCPKSRILGRLRESYSLGKRVAEYIRENHSRIKAIYANTHPTFGQYLLLDEAQLYGIPVLIHVQDIYPESLTQKIGFIGKLIEPILIKYDAKKMVKAKNILTISPQMKNRLDRSRHFPLNFVHIIYNWQNDSLFKDVPINVSERFTFMFVGSLNPTASVGTIIRAFGESKLKNAKLILAGDGNDKAECIELAKQYPEAMIEFIPVSPLQVPFVQAKADVLILSLKKKISETALPSKLPAYMFSAKPIIACVEKESDTGKIIVDSHCGWVVDPEDVHSLSNQMKACTTMSKNVLERMGMSGNLYAVKIFSQQVNLKRVCDMITNI